MLSRHFLKGRHHQQHRSSSSSLSFSSLSQLNSASSPRGGGGGACRRRNIPILTTLAPQQPKHDDGGGGGAGGNVCRFKSTAAAPRRLNNNDNKKNESSSSPASSSFASSFWDAAASTIQSAVGLSSNAVAQQSSLYFQTLRWKAANALMTSLSDSERQQLLQRLGISATTNNNDSDNNNNNNNNNSNNGMNSVIANNETVVDEMENKSSPTVVVLSVAEAVAAARVQEAMRNSSVAEANTAKQRQHREELWRQAQQAAHARVATEIATLQQQQQQQQHSTEKVGDATEAATATNNIETTDHHHHHHPILGPVVYDLGYKRCHVVSARQLTSIPVWEKQRIYRHDRAKSMAKDKLKSLHLGMPGVIALHQDVHGNLSILDGQHRVGMMAILADEMEQQQQPQENVEGNSSSNQAHFDLTRILVEVYPESKNSSRSSSESSSSSSHAADLFVEINKAEPVKLVDLPGMGAKKSEAHVINQGAHALHERYPEMFSASQRCRAPHLNLDNLRDALFQAQVVTRQKLKTPKALEVWLLEQNDALKQKYNNVNGDGDESSTSSSSWSFSKAALEKARKYDFYLGLETSWLSK